MYRSSPGPSLAAVPTARFTFTLLRQTQVYGCILSGNPHASACFLSCQLSIIETQQVSGLGGYQLLPTRTLSTGFSTVNPRTLAAPCQSQRSLTAPCPKKCLLAFPVLHQGGDISTFNVLTILELLGLCHFVFDHSVPLAVIVGSKRRRVFQLVSLIDFVSTRRRLHNLPF